MKRLIEFFFPKRETAFDLTAWVGRCAEVRAFDVTRHVRNIDTRSRNSLAVAFAIRATRPLANERI